MKMTITPEHARDMLSRNNMNRTINKRAVKTLADQIIKGEWAYNGQAIIISDKGVLLDGQHRLTACVEAGVSIESEVIKGVNSSVFGTMDTGRIRGASDCLGIRGVENSVFVASVLRALVLYSKMSSPVFVFGSAPTDKVLNNDIMNAMDWLDKNIFSDDDDFSSCGDFLSFAKAKMHKSHGFKIGAYGFAVLLTYLLNKTASLDFLDKVSEGLFSHSNDPAKKIKDYMNAGSVIPKKKKLGGTALCMYRSSMYFRAWNYFCDGKDIQSLRLHDVTVSPFNNKLCARLKKSFSPLL